MPQHKNKKHIKSKLWKSSQAGNGTVGVLVLSLVLLAGIGAAFLYRQQIKDWYALRSYQAPAIIKQLADQTTMTPEARKIFYVNSPILEEKSSFVSSCPDSSREQTIVLGCYHGNQGGIFLLDVSDDRLEGVVQVTAAHEMLHAVYDRLSADKKKEIDSMLMDFYEKGLTDERVKTIIDAYRKTVPEDLVNEMHSIFATEVLTLPANLEKYYKQYFSSRVAVAKMADHYKAEFTSRQNAVAAYDAQLATLKIQIDAAKQELESKQAQIDSQRSKLEQHKNNNDIDAYNAGVPVFNNLVDSYNSDVQYAKGLISQYNDIVAARNAIALEENQLSEELKGNSTQVKQ